MYLDIREDIVFIVLKLFQTRYVKLKHKTEKKISDKTLLIPEFIPESFMSSRRFLSLEIKEEI